MFTLFLYIAYNVDLMYWKKSVFEFNDVWNKEKKRLMFKQNV